jgi:hypothetical protein
LKKLIRFLRGNWGAPFIVAFVLLLLLSATADAIGAPVASGDAAVYAFFSLVIGIGLQTVSYRRQGREEDSAQNPPTDRPEWKPGTRRLWKLLAVFIALAIIVSSGAVLYDYGTTHGAHAPLVASVGNVHEIPETGGTVVVAFSILISGSVAPFVFQARWGDGTIQNSTTGAFSRAFVNETVPESVTVTVTGGDGEKARVTVQLPAPPTSTSSSSSGGESSASSASPSTSQASSSSSSSSSPPQTSGSMTATLGYLRSINGSGGVVTVFFGIDVQGGSTPYNFVAKWSDGVVQTSTQGTFTRTFTNGTIPGTVYVTVISADGQTTEVNVTIPAR